MEREQKQRAVEELTERLKATDTLIVADYRGLTNKQLEALRVRLVEHGARLTVVKNTLTRRAAEAAGADALLALLEGPTAIAFIESDGDPAAVAKTLADTARDAKVLALRGGVLQGAALTGDQVEELAKLPPADVLRGQLLGAIVAPVTELVSLLAAPVRDLVGLLDARIEQLGSAVDSEAPPAESAPQEAEDEPQAAEAESQADTPADDVPAESDTADAAGEEDNKEE
jgi:large subunit ribosomal protein L10